MKTILTFTLLLIFSTIYGFAQTKEVAKYIIQKSSFNGKDRTELDLDRGGMFIFYDCENGNSCMSNYSSNSKQQSYGRIFSVKMESEDETENKYSSKTFTFKWKYYNDYNKKSGYADVVFLKIYKPQGIIFFTTIILSNLDIYKYEGYMAGSLDFENL